MYIGIGKGTTMTGKILVRYQTLVYELNTVKFSGELDSNGEKSYALHDVPKTRTVTIIFHY